MKPRVGVAFRTFGNEGLLFHERQQRLYGLNPAATAVWRNLWCATSTDDDAVSRIAGEFGCCRRTATKLLNSCVSQWAKAGFLGPHGLEERDPLPRRQALRIAVPAPGTSDVFGLAGMSFAILAARREVRTVLGEFMGHLRIPEPRLVDFLFRVERARRGYRVIGPETVVPASNADAVIAVLKNEMMQAMLRTRSDMVALHAGGLLSENGVVLLAGSSGSGKTTLGALLNRKGWASIAEDVTLLRGSRSKLLGLPFSYAAKLESWPVLKQCFPNLEDFPVRTRPDYRMLRYLPPRQITQNSKQAPVIAIAFPRYRPGPAAEIGRMEKSAALVALLSEATNADHRLSAAAFHSLAMIVNKASVFELQYSDAVSAADLLRDTVGSGASRETSDTSGNPRCRR